MTRVQLFAISAILCWGSTVFAQSEISNDSFDQSQAQRVATAELTPDEMYAATFDIPQALLPVEMLGVRVVMVKGTDMSKTYCGRWQIEVTKETNAGPQGPPQDCPVATYKDPGAEIYSMSRQFANNPIAFEVQGDANNYQDLLFSSINNNPTIMATIPPVILNDTRIRVGLKAVDLQCGLQAGDAFPLMLTDTDGERTVGYNFLYGYPKSFCPANPRYYYWKDFAQFFSVQPGDFVMRVLLRTNNPMPDMGMDMTGNDMGSDMIVLDMSPDGSMDMTVVDMQTAIDMMNNTDMSMTQDMSTQDMSIADMSKQDMAVGQDMQMGKDMSGDRDMSSNAGDLSVTSISPDSGPTTQATDVAILGDGFALGVEVSLDAKKIGVVEVKPQRILANIPPGMSLGTYDVIITNPNGKSVILPDGFTIKDDSTQPTNNNNTSVDDGCSCRQVNQSQQPMWPMTLSILGLGLVVWRRRKRDTFRSPQV